MHDVTDESKPSVDVQEEFIRGYSYLEFVLYIINNNLIGKEAVLCFLSHRVLS